MDSDLIDVTEDSFDREVLASDLPVLVDCWAPGCGHCRMVTPIISELAEIYKGSVRFVKVNTDENPDFAKRFGVWSLPTLILFKNADVVGWKVGVRTRKYLKGWIDDSVHPSKEDRDPSAEEISDSMTQNSPKPIRMSSEEKVTILERSFANLYHIITGKTCAPSMGLGMATSAVVQLKDELNELREMQSARYALAQLFDAAETYLKDDSIVRSELYDALVGASNEAEVVVKKISPFKVISGNDADLIYWTECRHCGTLIGVDHAKEECILPLSCPTHSCPAHKMFAYGQKEYPFKYVTKEQMEKDPGIAEFVAFQRKLGQI